MFKTHLLFCSLGNNVMCTFDLGICIEYRSHLLGYITTNLGKPFGNVWCRWCDCVGRVYGKHGEFVGRDWAGTGDFVVGGTL